MQYQSYILRIYLGPTPFQSLSLLTTVNWGATEWIEGNLFYRRISFRRGVGLFP
jgi:hypothetical protein